MAKRRKRTRSIVRRVAAKVGRVRRRRAGGGGGRSMMGGLIPNTGMMMNAGIGGAAYVAGVGAAGKFLPSLSPTIAGVGSAFLVHWLGNAVLKNRDVGAGAIGALSADLVRQSGVLATLGLGDYYADYYKDAVHLGVPGGQSVGIPTSVNDMARHRRHISGDYGTSYGAN